MKLEMLFIGIALFGLAFVLGLAIYGEGLTNYGIDVDTSSTFGKMSNNLQQLNIHQEGMKADVQGGGISDANAVDEMVSGGYKAIRGRPFNTLEVASNLTQTLMMEINIIDPNITYFLTFTLGILVVFAIIYMIFRFRTG